MYSKVDLSFPSSMGKMLLKTLSIPFDKSLNCSFKDLTLKIHYKSFFELQLS